MCVQVCLVRTNWAGDLCDDVAWLASGMRLLCVSSSTRTRHRTVAEPHSQARRITRLLPDSKRTQVRHTGRKLGQGGARTSYNRVYKSLMYQCYASLHKCLRISSITPTSYVVSLKLQQSPSLSWSSSVRFDT